MIPSATTACRAAASAAALAAAVLAAGCGSDAPAEADAGPTGALASMSDWKGCEVFTDLEAVQEALGVTAVDGEVQSDGIDEGIDAEAAGCSGLFDLATFTDTASDGYEVTGDAAIRAGLAPWESDEEAAANFADRVEVREQNAAGIEYTDQQEGELGGEWDDSLTVTAETDHRTYVDAYGRSGDWVVYVSVDYLHDPGTGAYESAPEFYPDSSAEEMAVYPFTTAQFTDWLAQEYLPQVQSDILERVESE